MADLITKIDSLIDCYEHSITEHNKQFVDGVIYALEIVKGMIEQEAKK